MASRGKGPIVAEVREGEVGRVEGLLAGVDEDQATDADHGAQRDDEGVDARLPDDQPVDGTDDQPRRQRRYHGHRQAIVLKPHRQ